jgi:hypothetical protein
MEGKAQGQRHYQNKGSQGQRHYQRAKGITEVRAHTRARWKRPLAK